MIEIRIPIDREKPAKDTENKDSKEHKHSPGSRSGIGAGNVPGGEKAPDHLKKSLKNENTVLCHENHLNKRNNVQNHFNNGKEQTYNKKGNKTEDTDLEPGGKPTETEHPYIFHQSENLQILTIEWSRKKRRDRLMKARIERGRAK